VPLKAPLLPTVIDTAPELSSATPFGSEFQERTLLLLLSQPFSPSQLWIHKMLTLSAADALHAAAAAS